MPCGQLSTQLHLLIIYQLVTSDACYAPAISAATETRHEAIVERLTGEQQCLGALLGLVS